MQCLKSQTFSDSCAKNRHDLLAKTVQHIDGTYCGELCCSWPAALDVSTIILSKDIDKNAFMCGSNFNETDVMNSVKHSDNNQVSSVEMNQYT